MDDIKTSDHHMCSGCGSEHCGHHGMCGHHFGGKHFILRWVLGIAILAITFSVGVKIGEFKGMIESGSFGSFSRYGTFPGPHMMMWRAYDNSANSDEYYYPGPNMMYRFQVNKGATSTQR